MISSSDETTLSSVVIFLLLIFARFKKDMTHFELNIRVLIFSSPHHLSLACVTFAACIIIAYVYTTLTKIREMSLISPST